MLTLHDIKTQLRQGAHAWPGGYPKFFLACDGEPMSFKAVRANWREVVSAHLAKDQRNGGGAICGCDINWEDEHMICAHTNEPIECAYPKD